MIVVAKTGKLDGKFLVARGTEWSLVEIPEAFKDVVELGFTQFLSWNVGLYQGWQRLSEPDTSPSFSVSFSQNSLPLPQEVQSVSGFREIWNIEMYN